MYLIFKKCQECSKLYCLKSFINIYNVISFLNIYFWNFYLSGRKCINKKNYLLDPEMWSDKPIK